MAKIVIKKREVSTVLIKSIKYGEGYNYDAKQGYACFIVFFNNSSWAHIGKNGEILNQSRKVPGWVIAEPTEEMLSEAIKVLKNALNNNYKLNTFYVRYGDLPPSGRSKNYATGKLEKGVSVMEAKQNLITGEIELIPYGSPSYLSVMDRPLYEVSGDFVGYGSDGEPILQNCKIIRRIK